MKYGPYCEYCGHEQGDHEDGTGECEMTVAMVGPSDNTDVWEEPCDCGAFVPEYDYSDTEEYLF